MTVRRRFSPLVLVAVSLSLVVALPGDGHAQRGRVRARSGSPRVFLGPANANTATPGFAPFFQVAPGLNIQQAAFNTALMGRAYQQFPPYAMGFAPPYAMGYSPFGNPGVGAPGSSAA